MTLKLTREERRQILDAREGRKLEAGERREAKHRTELYWNSPGCQLCNRKRKDCGMKTGWMSVVRRVPSGPTEAEAETLIELAICAFCLPRAVAMLEKLKPPAPVTRTIESTRDGNYDAEPVVGSVLDEVDRTWKRPPPHTTGRE